MANGNKPWLGQKSLLLGRGGGTPEPGRDPDPGWLLVCAV